MKLSYIIVIIFKLFYRTLGTQKIIKVIKDNCVKL